MTQLKTVDFPRYADAYGRLRTDRERRAYLRDVVDRLPLPAATWTVPRAVDSVEWFASAADLCRTMVGLRALSRAPGTADVGRVLSLEGTTSLGLGTARWPVGWFKGGSEPGVLSRVWLARTAGGRTYVVSGLLSDPARSINDSAGSSELLAVANGAFALLARRTGPAPR